MQLISSKSKALCTLVLRRTKVYLDLTRNGFLRNLVFFYNNLRGNLVLYFKSITFSYFLKLLEISLLVLLSEMNHLKTILPFELRVAKIKHPIFSLLPRMTATKSDQILKICVCCFCFCFFTTLKV